VEAVFGVYGAERDALIARAKVVLNMHYYDSSIFEIVRVSYLLANRKAVVAECHPGTDVDPGLREAVRAVPYDGLVEACQGLVRDEDARTGLEERGYTIFSALREEDILGRIMGGGAAPPEPGSTPMPPRLNIGSGKDWREDCLNADINPSWGPDLLLDLCQPLDTQWIHPTSRFGPLRLGPGSFQEILANDVLEHLPDLPTAMGNCLALLKEGGRFHIQVPYDLSHGAWQDPTHVRAFNERSWLYYTDWFWYLGWTEARFELEALTYIPSELGQELVRKGLPQEELIRTPRAIDSMRVALRKRALTSTERDLVLSFRRRPGAVMPSPPVQVPAPAQVPTPVPAPGAPDTRRLYLDLMERCLLNLIYEDAPQDPWSGGAFNPDLRAGGRDWPSVAHTMIGQQRMANLRQLAEAVIREGIPGDFIETGVWRGGACIYLRAILEAHGIRDRKVFVADSFEGLPKPDPARYPADQGDLHHTFTPLAVSLEEVRSNFDKYGLLDGQVVFLKGWFKDTLPIAPIQRLALLRLDGDMYESTMDGLVNLYDKVSPGGFVIVDDFGAVKACAQAVHHFRASRGISDPIRNIDGIGVFWQKSH
jgi:O-methyltransferase/8-demethyl-8-(2,3-dimethoxy-alpha-L-rhamnosyl)tetracenomycin-C 4'-O-methyltransferase